MEKIMNIPGMGVIYDKDLEGLTLFSDPKEKILAAVSKVRCLNYNQCPVCYKCMDKAWHIYEICERCEAPPCNHKQKSRAHLIKPKNFTYKKEDAISKSIEMVYNKYIQNIGGEPNANEG